MSVDKLKNPGQAHCMECDSIIEGFGSLEYCPKCGVIDNSDRVSIKDLIGEPALLEQLAEEASELTHAALKLARVLRSENPTPVTQTQAAFNVIEEYTDVVQMARCLGISVKEQQILEKNARWIKRIESRG